jgi:serine/threonine-protein kinase RsbW
MHSLYRASCPQETLHSRDHPETWRSQDIHTTQEMDKVIEGLLVEVSAAGFSCNDTFGIRLALEEAIVNAIKHGNHYDRSKQVQIRYHVTEQCLLAEIEDQGPGFQPEEVPDPLADENLERSCGRGLFLMRAYMTCVRFNESGNRVTLCKKRSGA